ncbi:MAG: 30S ribosomal protein S16 [Clostridiales bacterium]|jgi:small subunit ribosomal protein S16|nr:30S ribosomal protein S16 [Clostridiales bacterium]
MVKIRLRRNGKKGNPSYKIVACDSRSPRDGKFIAILGHYNPLGKTDIEKLQLNTELLKHWIEVGAKLTSRVNFLYKKQCSTP